MLQCGTETDGTPSEYIFCSGLFGCMRLPWLHSFGRDASNVISTSIQQIFCCIVDLIRGRISVKLLPANWDCAFHGIPCKHRKVNFNTGYLLQQTFLKPNLERII